MNIDRIEIKGVWTICIREATNGRYHRRTLAPDSDISTEPHEVQAACNKAWTPEVIAAYEAHKAEQL